jgi:hypothetical protein
MTPKVDAAATGHRTRVSTGHQGRTGAVALGYWGPSLVRNLGELPEAEVAYVCDLRPGALEAVACLRPGIRQTKCVEEILSDSGVDAIALALGLRNIVFADGAGPSEHVVAGETGFVVDNVPKLGGRAGAQSPAVQALESPDRPCAE